MGPETSTGGRLESLVARLRARLALGCVRHQIHFGPADDPDEAYDARDVDDEIGTTSAASSSTEAPCRIRLTPITTRALRPFWRSRPRTPHQRPPDDLDLYALDQEGAGVITQRAVDECPHRLDFPRGDGLDRAVHADDRHDPGGLEDKALVGHPEPGKAVPREEGGRDLLSPVLPPAPADPEGEKGFHSPGLEAIPDLLLVPGAAADRVPVGRHLSSILMYVKHIYAAITLAGRLMMKRTTIFADEETLSALQSLAKEEGVSLAEIIRQALEAFLAQHRSSRPPLSIVGIGRSGRDDVAERAEELLLRALRVSEGSGR